MTAEHNSEKHVADGPDTSVHLKIKSGPAKGRYDIHPLANLFPLLRGQPYEELKKSIRHDGQQEPIIIDGRTILDGRNRLLILNDLGWEPKIVQFSAVRTELPASEWIVVQNLHRRHLTDDQVLAIATKLQPFLRRKSDHPASDLHLQSGGPTNRDKDPGEQPRPNQSQVADKPTNPELPPNSAENAKRKRGRPRGTRSDVEAVAKRTKQSRHKADQMSRLCKESPELFGVVERGELSLKEAMRQLKATQPRNSSTERAPKLDRVPEAVKRAEGWLRGQSLKLTDAEQIQFWKLIAYLAVSLAESKHEAHSEESRLENPRGTT